MLKIDIIVCIICMIIHIPYPNAIYMFGKIHRILDKIQINLRGIKNGNKVNCHEGGSINLSVDIFILCGSGVGLLEISGPV